MPSYNNCVFGCVTTGVTIHKFPNPAKYPELFRKWVALAADSLRGLTDDKIYRNRNVCDRHFAENVRNRYNRLNKLAVPTLHLPKHSIPLLECNIRDLSSTSPSGVPDSPNNQEKENTIIHATLTPASDLSDPPDFQEDCQSYIILLDEDELGSPEIVEKCQPIRHTQVVATTGLTDSDLSDRKSVSLSVSGRTSSLVDTAVIAKSSSSVVTSVLPGSPEIVEKCQPIRHTQVVATTGLTDSDLSGSPDNPDIGDKCQPIRHTQIVATTGLADRDLSGSINVLLMEHNYSTLYKSEPYRTLKPVKGPSNKDDVVIKEQQRKIKMLQSEVCRLRKKNAALKQRLRSARRPPADAAFQQLTKNMTTPAKLLINMQKLAQKNAKGRRFATDEKELCLSLFKRNPDSYKMLKEYLILPSCKVLARMK